MKILLKLAGMLCASLMAISVFAAQDLDASPSPVATQDPQAMLLSLEAKSDAQAQLFYEIVNSKLSFATSRSLCGRSGKWLAFVDIRQEFENGEPSGFSLQNASIQYGMSSLPQEATKGSITIGKETFVQGNTQAQNTFKFPSVVLEQTALNDSVLVKIDYKGTKIAFDLQDEFPNSKIPSPQEVIKLMAPAYVSFHSSKVKPQAIQFAFLNLRSYLDNVNTMERSYIWELYLVHSESLPGKATIIRYDIDSKSINVSQRTVKDY